MFAYWNEYGGWLNDFNKKFPELSRYMHEAFNLKEDELESILLLPMNNDITGYGFWHNDGDKAGYRMYLNNDVGSLFLRKTKKPYEFITFNSGATSHDEIDDGVKETLEELEELQKLVIDYVNTYHYVYDGGEHTPTWNLRGSIPQKIQKDGTIPKNNLGLAK